MTSIAERREGDGVVLPVDSTKPGPGDSPVGLRSQRSAANSRSTTRGPEVSSEVDVE